MTDREKAEEALVKAGFELAYDYPAGKRFIYTDGVAFANVYTYGTAEYVDIYARPRAVAHLFSSPALTEQECNALVWAISQCHPDARFDSSRYREPLRSVLARFGGGQG